MGPPAERRDSGSSAPALLVGVLTAVNLLNYVDRQILFAVFPAVKADLGLRDAELGLLASAFIVVYMANAPLAGYLGDRFRRLPIVSAAVGLWSVATVASGFARGFASLLASRAAVGVGESCYAPLSSALIADAVPEGRRGSALAIFNVAIPVGSALGYVLGGALGSRFGWRAAFWAVGAPGLALAALCLALSEPAPGGADRPRAEQLPADYRSLLTRPLWLLTTAAMAALTFALGALAAWMPTFLVRERGFSLGAAGITFGLLTAATGLIGTTLGGVLGDAALRRSASGHLWVSAVGLFLAAPLTWVAIHAATPELFWAAVTAAEILVFLNTGPLNAVLVSASAPATRAMAVAANVLLIHLFGDALSPWLVGELSDAWGLPAALGVMPPVLLVSGLFCVLAACVRRG